MLPSTCLCSESRRSAGPSAPEPSQEDSEDEFTFKREPGHGFAVDDGFTCLGVDDARQDRRAVANCTHDTAALPDVGGNRLQALRCRVVIQSRVAGGSEEEAIVLLFEIRCLLQLRL